MDIRRSFGGSLVPGSFAFRHRHRNCPLDLRRRHILHFLPLLHCRLRLWIYHLLGYSMLRHHPLQLQLFHSAQLLHMRPRSHFLATLVLHHHPSRQTQLHFQLQVLPVVGCHLLAQSPIFVPKQLPLAQGVLCFALGLVPCRYSYPQLLRQREGIARKPLGSNPLEESSSAPGQRWQRPVEHVVVPHVVLVAERRQQLHAFERQAQVMDDDGRPKCLTSKLALVFWIAMLALLQQSSLPPSIPHSSTVAMFLSSV